MSPRLLHCLLCFSLVFAQNPWVRRKKKGAGTTAADENTLPHEHPEHSSPQGIGKIRLDDDEHDHTTPGASTRGHLDTNDFDRLNKLVGEFGTDSLQMDTAWEGMAQMWEGLMDSPEMKEMLDDPAKLRAAITDNPLLQAIPGVDQYIAQLLESDTFQDPTKLKEAMRLGMNAFKSVGKEFTKEFGTQLNMLAQNPDGFAQQISDTLENVMADENLRKHIPGLENMSPEQLAEHLKQTQDLFNGFLQGGDQSKQEEVEVMPGGGHTRKRASASTTTSSARA